MKRKIYHSVYNGRAYIRVNGNKFFYQEHAEYPGKTIDGKTFDIGDEVWIRFRAHQWFDKAENEFKWRNEYIIE